ncbi:MAG: hypothetical protein JKY64_10095, partial [Alcanivorax sp.]|nr:hypothetical protein [Alcanivorax sp.]
QEILFHPSAECGNCDGSDQRNQCRGIANAWMDQRAPTEVAPYPDQHRLTSPLRKAAGVEWKSLWAGTGAHRGRALPVAELVQVIEDERRAASRSG